MLILLGSIVACILLLLIPYIDSPRFKVKYKRRRHKRRTKDYTRGCTLG